MSQLPPSFAQMPAPPTDTPDAGFPPGPPRMSAGLPAPTGGADLINVTLLLAATKPWVRFLSVLGFVGVGLMALGAVFMLIGAVASGSPGAMLLMLVYLPMVALYFFPALFLFKYASRIGALQASGSVHDLEAAMDAQRSFWKFVGICTLVGMVLYVVLFAAMMAGGLSMAANM